MPVGEQAQIKGRLPPQQQAPKPRKCRRNGVRVEGVSLRTTYRSDVGSVIQNGGGKVASLLDALRQKTGTQ